MSRRDPGPRGPLRRSLRWTVLAASLLAGCVGSGSPLRPAGPTPPDPPPLPLRKPWAQTALAPAAAAAPSARPIAVVAAPAPSAPAASASVLGYAVRSGDTVYGVGRRLSVPLRSIIDANGLRPPYTLRTGQVLRIPNPRRHVVAKGDTVYGIAQRYRLDLTELVRLNALPEPFLIAPGQELILPVPARTPRTAVALRPDASMPPRTAAVASAALPAPVPAGKSLPLGTRSAALQPPPQPVAARAPIAIPAPPPRGGGTFLWPVRGRLLTTYGPKAGGLYNEGINIAAPRGTPVLAADNGVVAYVGNELRGFGNLILIKHAGGWITAYAHNESLLVRRGEKVTRGQTIAAVGSTGNVAVPQLHFEIRKGTSAVDPVGLLDQQKASLTE